MGYKIELWSLSRANTWPNLIQSLLTFRVQLSALQSLRKAKYTSKSFWLKTHQQTGSTGPNLSKKPGRMTNHCECVCQGSVTLSVFRGTFNELQGCYGAMRWISDHQWMWYWVNKASGCVPNSALEHAWKCYLPISLLSLSLCYLVRSPGNDWSTFTLLMRPWTLFLFYTSFFSLSTHCL